MIKSSDLQILVLDVGDWNSKNKGKQTDDELNSIYDTISKCLHAFNSEMLKYLLNIATIFGRHCFMAWLLEKKYK